MLAQLSLLACCWRAGAVAYQERLKLVVDCAQQGQAGQQSGVRDR